jgi:hypothetical protein
VVKKGSNRRGRCSARCAAAVGDLEGDPAGGFGAGCDHHRGAGIRGLRGVLEQIHQHLHHATAVDQRARRRSVHGALEAHLAPRE